MKDPIVEINFYEEKKFIKLPEKFDLFKLGIISLLGSEVDLNYLNIFYKDDEKDKVNIDTEEEYKQLITQIKNKEVKILIVELKQNEEKSKSLKFNNNSKIKEDEKISEIINSVNINNCIKNNEKEINKNEIDINFPVMCSICKKYDLKNEFYYCIKCNNFYCFECFEQNKKTHEHSINAIFNQSQYDDIFNNKNVSNKESENNDKIEPNLFIQSKINDIDKKKNNNLNENNKFENNNKINENNKEENKLKQNIINKKDNNIDNNIDNNKILKIKELRLYEGMDKYTDEQLEELLQKVNWDINKVFEKLF